MSPWISRIRVAVALMALCSCGKKHEPAKVDKPWRVPLVVEAERLAASRSRTPEEVRPYDESLSWHEYRVRRVVSGELKAPVIRVAHWTVLHGKPVPVGTAKGEVVTLKITDYDAVDGLRSVNRCDELDIAAEEPPRFLDLSQPLPPRVVAADQRFDYGNIFSEQMMLYWKFRGQLRLVAMGNSQATKDIATPLFFEEENDRTPVALNLAPPGACMELATLLMHEYVIPLPKIEWVVWVTSPRMFNGRRDETRKYREFIGSPGYAWDRAHHAELWPVPAGPPVLTAQLEKLEVFNVDLWGWEGRRKTLLPEDSPEAAREAIRKEMSKPEFSISEPRWKMFTEALAALTQRGVRVLLVNVPNHPLMRQLPAADPDGTTHEGMAELVRRLEGLHTRFSKVWFRDFNLAGRHDFAPEDFYDADHLNRNGSRELTRRIIAWMEECAREKA